MQKLSGRLRQVVAYKNQTTGSLCQEEVRCVGVLCIIGCPVHLIREVYSRLHLCRHTFFSLWGDCLCFASLWRVNSRADSYVLGVHLPNVCWGVLFLFVKRSYFKSLLKVYHRSVFVESSKRSTSWVKFYFRLQVSLHIFQHGSSLSLEKCATTGHGAFINETGLFSSAAVVPQSKSTELCSSAAVVPQSKST